MGSLFASGFEWIDANEFWLATVEYDLVRVDAGVLRESLADGQPGDAALSLAITATVPVEVLSGDFLLDEETGELWSQQVRVGPDFELHIGGRPLFIDAAGYPWTNSSPGLRRARSLDANHTLESVSLPQGAQQTSVDMSSGSLWVLTSAPTLLQEVTSEGLLGPGFLLSTGSSIFPFLEKQKN